MNTNYLTWNPDPIIFEIGFFAIRWYGVLFLIGYLVGYKLVDRTFRRENLSENSLSDLSTNIFLAMLIGARLGHCLLYDPSFYLANPLEILMFWKGGLASHGGMIGIFIGLCLHTKKHTKPNFIRLLDILAPAAAFACSTIRLGNLMNSEILGRVTSKPWGLIFTRIDGADGLPRHPSQLYEAIAYFIVFIILYVISKRKPSGNGLLIGLFLLLIFTARFLLEFTKIQQAEFANVLPLNLGALLSIPPIILGLYLTWRATLKS